MAKLSRHNSGQTVSFIAFLLKCSCSQNVLVLDKTKPFISLLCIQNFATFIKSIEDEGKTCTNTMQSLNNLSKIANAVDFKLRLFQEC